MLDANKIIFILLLSWLALWSASVTQEVIVLTSGNVDKIWILDADYEESLYTWFSTVLLSFAALFAFFLSLHKAEQSKGIQRQWQIIGAIFFLLSADEMLSFHEKINNVMSRAFNFSGIFEFAWVIPAIFIVIFLGVMFLPFLRRLPSHVSRTIIAAGAIFVFGAVGMEMVAGLFVSESSVREEVFASPIYRLLTNIEEGLEALGVILFIKALFMQAELYFPILFRTSLNSAERAAA